MQLYLAMGIGFVLASLSDWLFMGILFHRHYKTFPEVWRDTTDERGKIIVAQAFAALTAVGFVLLASALGLVLPRQALALAFAIWIIGPLPLLLGNHLFIKLDKMVTISHSLAWLVKLLLVAGVTAALL